VVTRLLSCVFRGVAPRYSAAILATAPVDVLFWLFMACVAYAYAGYPLLLVAASLVLPARKPSLEFRPSERPLRVTLVVPAYNEAAVLNRRIENLRVLRFPADRIEFLLGSDGSTDGTAAVAASVPDPRFRVVNISQRAGKTALLNTMVALSTADLLVFTDANSEFDEDALQHLVAPFADPTIGCVIGELVYLNRREAGVRAGEGLYWRFENAIKEMESRFGGTLVATGAIYALRRSIWQHLPAGISDDSVAPLLALKAGYRVVVEPKARAFERAANDLSEEFARKARMVTRQLGAHRYVGYFLKPLQPMLAFRLASHKLMRWLVPFFLTGAFVANLFLLAQPFYQATLAIAGLGAIAFFAGRAALKHSIPLPAVLRLWVYFCTVNSAACTGVIDFLRGRHRAVWAVSPSTR
jgi:cellulose synthase/poly-beta-1,6-N-acetylglucosamine synthase-like glycosyltransferase